MLKLYHFFMILIVAMAACNGPKQLLKEAKVYEDGGLKDQAYQSYEAIYNQYHKPEALVGMKRIAQFNLDDKFQKAQLECMRGNHEMGLSLFDDAFAYAEMYSRLQLQVPLSASDQQAQCKADLIELLYTLAEEAVINEEYDLAKGYIQKLKRYDRNHKKAEYLELLSEIYPNYNSGVKAMSLELYRDAYTYFNEVCKLDADFKDALSLRDACLAKARFTMAYVPMLKDNVSDDVQATVSAYIKQQILALKSPFVELVERESLDAMLQEQMNSMNAAFDQNDVIEAGKLSGARYIITGELIKYDHLVSKQRGIEKKAYLGPRTSDKKVRYTEYHLGRGIDASFRYKIIDAETGKIYASEVIPYEVRDNVVWADFEGDYEMLYPGEWKWQLIGSKEDIVNQDDRDDLLALFEGRKGPISEMELQQRMMKEIGEKVAKAVKDFKP
jgi:hypothetical protein